MSPIDNRFIGGHKALKCLTCLGKIYSIKESKQCNYCGDMICITCFIKDNGLCVFDRDNS